MTFNVLEYARQGSIPIVFSSSREVYGDVHRFEGYDERAADFAYTESTYSASKIAGEAFIYSYARCYGLRISSSASPTSTAATTTTSRRMVRVIPLFIHSLLARRADHDLRRPRQDSRLHLRGRLRRRDHARRRGARRGHGRQRDDQPRLRRGQHARALAERIAHELGVEPQMTLAPSLLGEVTHYVADLRRRARCSATTRRCRSTRASRARSTWFRDHRARHPEEDVAGARRPRAGAGARAGLEDACRPRV